MKSVKQAIFKANNEEHMNEDLINNQQSDMELGQLQEQINEEEGSNYGLSQQNHQQILNK